MTPSAETGSFIFSICAGVGVLLIGIGIFFLCSRAGGLLTRLGKTLDEVDVQIGALGAPIATTLTHVGGIADTADTTIARLGAVVGQLENVASGASKTANLIGATLSSVSSMRKPSRPAEQGDGAP